MRYRFLRLIYRRYLVTAAARLAYLQEMASEGRGVRAAVATQSTLGHRRRRAGAAGTVRRPLRRRRLVDGELISHHAVVVLHDTAAAAAAVAAVMWRLIGGDCSRRSGSWRHAGHRTAVPRRSTHCSTHTHTRARAHATYSMFSLIHSFVVKSTQQTCSLRTITTEQWETSVCR